MSSRIGKGPPYDRLPTAEFDEEDRKSIQKQLKRQDDSLDILSSSAMRLGELSLSISNEIQQQNRMLDGLEEDVDRVQTNMDIINIATEKLIKKAG
jgi:syntaxin 6